MYIQVFAHTTIVYLMHRYKYIMYTCTFHDVLYNRHPNVIYMYVCAYRMKDLIQ